MDLKISEILEMQKNLQEKNKGKWTPLSPETGRNSILWMMEEMGEVISIIKKKGDEKIMDDPETRRAFVEEMTDVMMYFNDTLLSYGISSEEFSRAFIEKHSKNMGRDYTREYIDFLK